MAETVHLILTASGTAIQGESTQHSLERENTIECLTYEQSIETQREAGSGVATGRRTLMPIIITKRSDKSTPLLIKHLCDNSVLEAKFMFFRPSPKGDGTTQKFYTVELKGARISKFKQESPDVLQPSMHAIPPLDRVEFVYAEITWTYTDGGITHHDSWLGQK